MAERTTSNRSDFLIPLGYWVTLLMLIFNDRGVIHVQTLDCVFPAIAGIGYALLDAIVQGGQEWWNRAP